MADQGNAVLGGRLDEERVGVSAVGALEVIELHDGDARAGRRLKGAGVVDLCGFRRAELGVGGCRSDDKSGDGQHGEDEGKGKAGEVSTAVRSGRDKGHRGWTTP